MDKPSHLQAVTDRARDLRSAVIAGDHRLAKELASAYVEALSIHWESMTQAERALSTLPTEARAVLLWAHQSTLIQKAMTAEHLAVLQKSVGYHRSSKIPRLHWRA